jgi:hypothetical protein
VDCGDFLIENATPTKPTEITDQSPVDILDPFTTKFNQYQSHQSLDKITILKYF